MPWMSQFTIKLDSFWLEWKMQDLGTGQDGISWALDHRGGWRIPLTWLGRLITPWDRRSQGRLCSCYWSTALCDGGIFPSQRMTLGESSISDCNNKIKSEMRERGWSKRNRETLLGSIIFSLGVWMGGELEVGGSRINPTYGRGQACF